MNVYDLYWVSRKDTSIAIIQGGDNEINFDVELEPAFKGRFECCPVMYFSCIVRGIAVKDNTLFINI